MKKFVITFIFSAILAGAFSPAQAADVGRVAAIRGTVELLRKAGPVAAALDARIQDSDIIVTGMDSRVKLLFADDSLLTLSGNTTLGVREFAGPDGKRTGRYIFNLKGGEVRALPGKSRFEIHTPTSAVAANGTFYTVRVETEEGLPVTKVFAHDGDVETLNIKSGIGGRTTIKKGEMTLVRMDTPPTRPVPIPQEIEQKLFECGE